jgi:hypothetical protein
MKTPKPEVLRFCACSRAIEPWKTCAEKCVECRAVATKLAGAKGGNVSANLLRERSVSILPREQR